MNNKNTTARNGMNKKDVILIVAGLAILTLIMTSSYFLPREGKSQDGEVIVLTDKHNYKAGEDLKVKIENNLEEPVCFSSCYPYYIGKENGEWKPYKYEECEKENITDNCVAPHGIKAFELEVPASFKGSHRLMIQACVGCGLRQPFQKERELFSNPFNIE